MTKTTGKYRVSADIASKSLGVQFTIQINGQTLKGIAPVTGDWYKYQTVDLGEVTLNKGANAPLEMRAIAENWNPMNVKSVRLTLVK